MPLGAGEHQGVAVGAGVTVEVTMQQWDQLGGDRHNTSGLAAAALEWPAALLTVDEEPVGDFGVRAGDGARHRKPTLPRSPRLASRAQSPPRCHGDPSDTP